MDVFTRRIIGFGIAPACIDGVSVCRMFNCATAGRPKPEIPQYRPCTRLRCGRRGRRVRPQFYPSI
jgi:hypothetical protein